MSSGVLSTYARRGAILAGEDVVAPVSATVAASTADVELPLTATTAVTLPNVDDEVVGEKVKRARTDNSPTMKSQQRVPRTKDGLDSVHRGEPRVGDVLLAHDFVAVLDQGERSDVPDGVHVCEREGL